MQPEALESGKDTHVQDVGTPPSQSKQRPDRAGDQGAQQGLPGWEIFDHEITLLDHRDRGEMVEPRTAMLISRKVS